MPMPGAPSGGGADEQEDPTAGGDAGGQGGQPGGQTPQDVVKATVGLVSKATKMLDEATGIVAQVNKQFPGSQKQAQMIAQMLQGAQKQLASMMADIVKATSRQTEPSTKPGPFSG